MSVRINSLFAKASVCGLVSALGLGACSLGQESAAPSSKTTNVEDNEFTCSFGQHTLELAVDRESHSLYGHHIEDSGTSSTGAVDLEGEPIRWASTYRVFSLRAKFACRNTPAALSAAEASDGIDLQLENPDYTEVTPTTAHSLYRIASADRTHEKNYCKDPNNQVLSICAVDHDDGPLPEYPEESIVYGSANSDDVRHQYLHTVSIGMQQGTGEDATRSLRWRSRDRNGAGAELSGGNDMSAGPDLDCPVAEIQKLLNAVPTCAE